MNPRTWLKQRILAMAARRNERRRRELHQERGLSPSSWGASVEGGRLIVGGCDVAALSQRYCTPLYVIDELRLRQDYAAFSGAFTTLYPRVEVGCSYKTNPLPGVLRVLHDCGALAEVISHFELWLALELGVPPNSIIFNGPAKTPQAIDLAVGRGIKLINVDNFEEIDLIADAALRHGVRQPVGVRVVTSVGWQAQFGLRLHSGEARAAFDRIRALPQLDPIALHVHLGTGIKDIPLYLRAIREMLEFARALERDTKLHLGYFDFGGGFGVPTVQPLGVWDSRMTLNGYPVGPVETDKAPRPADYARAICSLMREYYDEAALPTIAFEPGRAITSQAQSLLLTVLAAKRGRDGISRVILDGGKNLALPTGYEYHEILPATRMNEPLDGQLNFYGPLCHPGDVLAVAKPFPRIEPGDVVAIMDAGAYFVPNQMNFSNPRPAAVMVRDGEVQLIRARESFSDIVRLDSDVGSAASTADLPVPES